MKKTIGLSIIFILALFFVGCKSDKKDGASGLSHSHSDSTPTEGVEYNGIVKEDGIASEQQLMLKNLEPVETAGEAAPFDEVILLTEGVPILNAETHEKATIEDIKAGTSVTVLLVPEPITTRSLPPQIPGNSILKILVSKE